MEIGAHLGRMAGVMDEYCWYLRDTLCIWLLKHDEAEHMVMDDITCVALVL